MSDSPFFGPSYQLKRRIAGIQRLVNMCLAPLESGNERAQYVLKDTQGLVLLNQTYAPPAHGDTGWIARTLPLSASWQYVAWSENLTLFVAMVPGAYCATSPDGIMWTQRSMPLSAGWIRVVWADGLGKFVATTLNSANVALSVDGINWTAQSLAVSGVIWGGLAYNGTTLCLVENGGFSGGNRVATSTDGVTWAVSAALPVTASWDGITWAPELGVFCTVASYSTRAATSPDGLTWSAKTLPANKYWREIAWSGSRFVVTDYDNTASTCLTSSDGSTWTERALPATANWGSVCWSARLGLFCIVGLGGRSLTSPDGIAWTPRAMDGNFKWYAVCYGNSIGTFVALAQDNTAVANSWNYF